MSGSLGDREMLWEHEPQASVSTAFDYQNVNSLCSCHHHVNSTSEFRVSIELSKHNFKPISACAFLGLFSKRIYYKIQIFSPG